MQVRLTQQELRAIRALLERVALVDEETVADDRAEVLRQVRLVTTRIESELAQPLRILRALRRAEQMLSGAAGDTDGIVTLATALRHIRKGRLVYRYVWYDETGSVIPSLSVMLPLYIPLDELDAGEDATRATLYGATKQWLEQQQFHIHTWVWHPTQFHSLSKVREEQMSGLTSDVMAPLSTEHGHVTIWVPIHEHDMACLFWIADAPEVMNAPAYTSLDDVRVFIVEGTTRTEVDPQRVWGREHTRPAS